MSRKRRIKVVGMDGKYMQGGRRHVQFFSDGVLVGFRVRVPPKMKVYGVPIAVA